MWRKRERRGKGEREGEKEGEKEERQRGRKRKGGSRNDTRYFSSFYEISAPRRFCFLGQNEAQMMSVVLWIWPPLLDFRGGGSHHKTPHPECLCVKKTALLSSQNSKMRGFSSLSQE